MENREQMEEREIQELGKVQTRHRVEKMQIQGQVEEMEIQAQEQELAAKEEMGTQDQVGEIREGDMEVMD